jgi:hypothetical protein
MVAVAAAAPAWCDFRSSRMAAAVGSAEARNAPTEGAACSTIQ